MRYIDLLVALTAVAAVVNAAPVEKREVVNADSPFDNKAFHFDPKMNKREPDLKLSGGTGKIQPPPGFALQIPPPVPVAAAAAPPPVPAAPSPSINNQDTVVINIDNKINH